jgi:hypothetical protein
MLRELCRAPENETEDLMAATKVLSDAGWLPGVDSTLADGLLDPGANPETGALWIRTRVRAVSVISIIEGLFFEITDGSGVMIPGFSR